MAVAGDAVAEPDEGFIVNLSGAGGASLADASGAGTIAQRRRRSPPSRSTTSPSPRATAARRTPSSRSASRPPTRWPSRVNYATANGTAVAGSDYTATSGTLTFAAGVTSQTRERARAERRAG